MFEREHVGVFFPTCRFGIGAVSSAAVSGLKNSDDVRISGAGKFTENRNQIADFVSGRGGTAPSLASLDLTGKVPLTIRQAAILILVAPPW